MKRALSRMPSAGRRHSVGLLCPLFHLALFAALFCASAAQAGPPPGSLIGTSAGQLLAIDPATGDRPLLSGSAMGAGPNFSLRPLDVVLETSGDFVVADFDERALIRVDGETGDRTIIASDAVGAGGAFRPVVVEIEPDGSLLTVNTEEEALVRVDPVSGDRTTIASETIGTGPVMNGIQDVLRVGPYSAFGVPAPDLLVADSQLNALLFVRASDGFRFIASGPGIGSGPDFITPRGVALTSVKESISSRFFVVDSGLNAVVEVVLGFGDRSIVSSASVGTGPNFSLPYSIWPSPDGALYVSDVNLGAVIRVDPDTGDRTIVAGSSVGSGPGLGSLWNLSAIPTPGRIDWSFEEIEDGGLPAYIESFPAIEFATGNASVVRAADFTGPITATDGDKVLYLTTGPRVRGEPTGEDLTGNGTDEYDESSLILFVDRGQNDPPRLRFTVDYLTSEGSQPDPADISILQFLEGTSTPLSQLSMAAPNGPLHTALTGFSGGPITGPDGSFFGEGHTGPITYEIDVDYPGVALEFSVKDEGDAHVDTAMLIDDVRFVPEPGSCGMLAMGGLGLAALGRRSRKELTVGAQEV